MPTMKNAVWGDTAPLDAVQQVFSFLSRKLAHLKLAMASDGRSFRSTVRADQQKDGVMSIRGELVDDSEIRVKMQLLRSPENARVPVVPFLGHLSAIGEKCRLLSPERDKDTGDTSLFLELRVQATPMSLTREGAFLQQLTNLEELAKNLQSDLPAYRSDKDLLKEYEKVSEFLEPVILLGMDEQVADMLVKEWALDIVEFLAGGASVALCSSFSVVGDFAAGVLAAALREAGGSLGRLAIPMVNAKALVELAKKAPGTILVPAVSLSLGSNPYELSHDAEALLATLSASGNPAVFSGSLMNLQAVFHGGQGSPTDPLCPVVVHVPDVPVETLVRFAVETAARKKGGLPSNVLDDFSKQTASSLEGLSEAEQRRLLPIVASRTVNIWGKTGKSTEPGEAEYVSKLGSLSETLAGLSSRPRASRSPRVQEHYTQVLTDPSFLAHFRSQIFGQEAALEDFAARMRVEILGRPLHQPIRCCLQGTPGTGKSQTAAILARHLEVPYDNIDAASMSDPHTASSQLLGSGRGIVESHRSGRLEQAAKHHAGAVVEVSDLDHAVPTVRSALAELFVQSLETGEAQSAKGAMFSCTNLIIIFTVNLPGGQDEAVRKKIGFGGQPSSAEVSQEVTLALKRMVSGAFVSRVGRPILFAPLDREARAKIIERSIKESILSAARRIHVELAGICLEEKLGHSILDFLGANTASLDARSLMEHGRGLATHALLELHQNKALRPQNKVHVSVDHSGNLAFIFEKKGR